MGSNIYIVIFVFSFVIGVIGSATIVFYILDNRQSHQFQDKAFKSSIKKKEKTKDVMNQNVENDERVSEEQPSLLKKRLGKERDSWKEFNCIADGIEEHDSIKYSQKKEDSSYHYIKRKSQK